MSDHHDWKDGLQILCVRLDNLGDVLMTTPAFRALKSTWPTCRLTLLTSSVGAAIAGFIPEIDQVIRFDVPWVQGESEKHESLLSMADQLKDYAFDAAILFTVQSQSPLPAAMLCYLTGISRVLGYCRENPYRLISDWIPDPEVLVATRHEVERQLALVAAIGCQTDERQLSLRVSPADEQSTRRMLLAEGLDPERPWLVLHPGVSEARRRYPARDFAEAAAQLIREDQYQIVLTGSSTEQALTESVRQQIYELAGANVAEPGQVLNLAGRLTIGQLIALLADAPLLIANNTGPVHIAAAVETPVIVLYAKTNPQHTPWQVPSQVLYFDVPVPLRSRNVLLQHFPESIRSNASPKAIVEAVRALAKELMLTSID